MCICVHTRACVVVVVVVAVIVVVVHVWEIYEHLWSCACGDQRLKFDSFLKCSLPYVS